MKHSLKSLAALLIILAGCNNAPAISTPTKVESSFKNTVVSLTFDDGDADNYSVRFTLAENNLHATFYIVSGFTNSNGYMTDNQLRDLYNDGNEIGGHTLSHKKLSDIHGADLNREICQDRSNLLAYGFKVTSFAYPFGYYNDESKQAVKDCGYNSARGVSGGPERIPPVDAYRLQAMPYIVSDTHFTKMVRYVTEVKNNGGGWAIFVFHHVCDGCNQYAIMPGTFARFAQWLAEQRSNGLDIKTVGEVLGGK
jgi:peptidoglycan/xylan/chitin deacetylase (PgdA/CDA1 family)